MQPFHMYQCGTRDNQETPQLPAYNIIRPKISWENDDGLYNQFMLGKQKCKLILDCQLKNTSNQWKAKSVLQ